MNAVRARIGEGGRLVIPAEFRKALGVVVGDTVIIALHDQELTVLTPAMAMKQASDYVRSVVPDSVSLVDDLIAERRAEAARE